MTLRFPGVSKGVEAIRGVVKDPRFGKLLMADVMGEETIVGC